MKECIDPTGILNRNSVFLPCSRKKMKKKYFKANLAKEYHKPIFIIVVNRFFPNLKRLKDEKYISMP